MARPDGGYIAGYVAPNINAAPGVWSLRDMLPSQRANSWPLPSVSLLLHMDGQASAFTDSSPIAKTVTAVGSATQSADQSRFGGKSLYLNGTDSYLNIANNAAFAFGNSDFCIELWLYAAAQTFKPIVNCTSLVNLTGFALWNFDNNDINASTRRLLFMLNGNQFRIVASEDCYADNTWTYIAVSRTGSAVNMYSNGSRVASGTFTGSVASPATPFRVGQVDGTSWSVTRYLEGYIDELRITRGSGRGYTGSTISVPTEPFPSA